MYDIAIIGGGIVGLATGVKILQSRPDLKIVILEKEYLERKSFLFDFKIIVKTFTNVLFSKGVSH